MSRGPRVKGGWLMVPYRGEDLSCVEIAVGDRDPGPWRGAFLSWDGRDRVAMIRPPQTDARALKVWLRVDNVAEQVGQVRL